MKWHHSLYWRIAVGFVACLALLLIVQAMLFVWVVARSGPNIPNQPPDRFAQAIAIDLTQALEQQPTLTVETYIRQEYANDSQPFFIVFADQPPIEVGGSFPSPMVEEVRARLDAMIRSGRFPGNDPPRGFGSRGPGGRGRLAPGEPPAAERFFGRGQRSGPLRLSRPAPVRPNGQLIGLVVVPQQPPFTFLLSRYAPTLAGVALITLVVGALLATVAIFGPARRRLRAVEDAARRLGAGDLTARAPIAGSDEVSAVAVAFNTMANDLAARAEALAESDRVRRQLLADVSHELNTPVTAMRGYLETLAMPEMRLDDTTRARYLRIVGDETARLEHIIGDLLELARLEGDASALVVQSVPVSQLFERVAARQERQLAEAKVTMRVEVAEGAASVRGDRDRLEQALQNLAANALRYAPSGSAIVLSAKRDGNDVVLGVADSGAGIAPEHLRHVFDRFYKADASRGVRQSGGGSGLGLSIVKAIVERHGGTVHVDSAPGRTVIELRIRN